MSALIISAFPACGKSYYYNTHSVYSNHVIRDYDSELKILDSDSSGFSWIVDEEGNKVRNPEFPQNYIDHIKEKRETEDIIFVSSHDEVRRALNDAGIRFFLIYPNLQLKDFWLETVKNRETGINSESFVNMLNENWYKFIRGIEESFMENCVKIEISAKDIFIESIVAANINVLKQIAENPSIYNGYNTKFEISRGDNTLINFNLMDVRSASLNNKIGKNSSVSAVKKSMDEKTIDIVTEYVKNHLDKSDNPLISKYIPFGRVKYFSTGSILFLQLFQIKCIMNLLTTAISQSGILMHMLNFPTKHTKIVMYYDRLLNA